MEEVSTFSEGDLSSPPDLRLLHYNDVYHIDSSSAEPVGGIARFQTLCKYYKNDFRFEGQSNLLTFFSGDAFNPSLESSVTKGSHMVPVLNLLGTDVACVGNHDLDFGVQQFQRLANKCNFPWLLANVFDPALGNNVPLGNAKSTVILTASNGIKIGVIGLVEREWLETINSLPPDLIYKSASATAKELVPSLREQGAEIIIAVTHQREPNDNKLAEKSDGVIDIVLGGHDHFYQHSLINGTHVLRSGTDFKQLSYIEARRNPDKKGKWNFHIVRRDVVSRIAPDAEAAALAENTSAKLKSKLEKPLGYSSAPLDARFTTVRQRESNLGNWVCDLMRFHYQGDCALMAAGTIRGDQIYPPGVLRVRDLLDCFPFEDPCVVIRITGTALLSALENSVSAYPALEGRFPQVSNIAFAFNPSLPPNSRIIWVKVNNLPLSPTAEYNVVTRGYMARGKDGFDSLLVESEGGKAKEVVHEENGILISMLLRQYFLSLKILGRWKHWGDALESQWKGIHDELHDVHPVMKPRASAVSTPMVEKVEPNIEVGRSALSGQVRIDDEEDDHDHEHSSDEEEQNQHQHQHYSRHHVIQTLANKKKRDLMLARKVIRKWRRLAGLKGHSSAADTLGEEEFQVEWTHAIAPRLEGRIQMTTDETPLTLNEGTQAEEEEDGNDDENFGGKDSHADGNVDAATDGKLDGANANQSENEKKRKRVTLDLGRRDPK